MEYIEGDTLARARRARATTSASACRAPDRRCASCSTRSPGLHAAHELARRRRRSCVDLVHRDVLAAEHPRRHRRHRAHHRLRRRARATRLVVDARRQLKGKLAYMAPEQAHGRDIDRRADLFAMGIVLWEVLAGKRLFKGESEAGDAHRVLFEPIPRLRDVAPACRRCSKRSR